MWGFQDEVWWSRFAQPNLSSWCEEQQTLLLVEQVKQKDDPDPKALACYGILLRWMETDKLAAEKMLLRFVNGRPVSDITIQFLNWTCKQIEALGKSVLVMVWDNARWHTSKAACTWIREHNQDVKHSGKGVRILSFFLPIKSPWLNPIEPNGPMANAALSSQTERSLNKNWPIESVPPLVAITLCIFLFPKMSYDSALSKCLKSQELANLQSTKQLMAL